MKWGRINSFRRRIAGMDVNLLNMTPETSIYLDFNSTTPVDPMVLEAMLPYFTDHFANAASRTHFPGRAISDVVEQSRTTIAQYMGCEPPEIIFTSGSAESINLAIKGVAGAYSGKGKHIISWSTEHKAVLDVLKRLESDGFDITLLPVNRDGLPDETRYREALREDTILVAMMLANNETGVVHPVKEFAAMAHENNSLFFCDATQGPGRLQVSVNDLGVDLLCISAHKMYGPKGIGGLFVRRKNPRVSLEPIMDGGGHERGLRPGTLNVPGIVGFSKATEIANAGFWEETARLSRLRTLLEQHLIDNGRGYVNGSIKNRLPNTTNILFPGFKAETIISRAPRLAVATGSACTSALPEPSHVLTAMGLTHNEAYASIRFSLGRTTTESEIMEAVAIVLKAIS